MGAATGRSNQRKVLKRAKRSVKLGITPVFVVDIENRIVPDLPHIEFDGPRPEEAIEGARRSIAAEIGVRPHEVEVTPIAPSGSDSEPA